MPKSSSSSSQAPTIYLEIDFPGYGTFRGMGVVNGQVTKNYLVKQPKGAGVLEHSNGDRTVGVMRLHPQYEPFGVIPPILLSPGVVQIVRKSGMEYLKHYNESGASHNNFGFKLVNAQDENRILQGKKDSEYIIKGADRKNRISSISGEFSGASWKVVSRYSEGEDQKKHWKDTFSAIYQKDLDANAPMCFFATPEGENVIKEGLLLMRVDDSLEYYMGALKENRHPVTGEVSYIKEGRGLLITKETEDEIITSIHYEGTWKDDELEGLCTEYHSTFIKQLTYSQGQPYGLSYTRFLSTLTQVFQHINNNITYTVWVEENAKNWSIDKFILNQEASRIELSALFDDLYQQGTEVFIRSLLAEQERRPTPAFALYLQSQMEHKRDWLGYCYFPDDFMDKFSDVYGQWESSEYLEFIKKVLSESTPAKFVLYKEKAEKVQAILNGEMSSDEMQVFFKSVGIPFIKIKKTGDKQNLNTLLTSSWLDQLMSQMSLTYQRRGAHYSPLTDVINNLLNQKKRSHAEAKSLKRWQLEAENLLHAHENFKDGIDLERRQFLERIKNQRKELMAFLKSLIPYPALSSQTKKDEFHQRSTLARSELHRRYQSKGAELYNGYTSWLSSINREVTLLREENDQRKGLMEKEKHRGISIAHGFRFLSRLVQQMKVDFFNHYTHLKLFANSSMNEAQENDARRVLVEHEERIRGGLTQEIGYLSKLTQCANIHRKELEEKKAAFFDGPLKPLHAKKTQGRYPRPPLLDLAPLLPPEFNDSPKKEVLFKLYLGLILLEMRKRGMGLSLQEEVMLTSAQSIQASMYEENEFDPEPGKLSVNAAFYTAGITCCLKGKFITASDYEIIFKNAIAIHMPLLFTLLINHGFDTDKLAILLFDLSILDCWELNLLIHTDYPIKELPARIDNWKAYLKEINPSLAEGWLPQLRAYANDYLSTMLVEEKESMRAVTVKPF